MYDKAAGGAADGGVRREQEPEAEDPHRLIKLESVDAEYYISMEHGMSKEHRISFLAYVTAGYSQMVKLYPEPSAECRFAKRGRGLIYAYCNRHGLYRITV